MRKVIYISFCHLTDRIWRDYYIDYLIEKGVSVEYWDVVSLVFEEQTEAGMISPACLRMLSAFSDLEAMLSLPENRDALYVMLVTTGGRFTKIYRLLSKYNCRLVYFAVGARPVLRKPGYWKIFSHACHPLRLLRVVFDKPKTCAYRRLKLIKPFDIIFAAGSVMMANDEYAAKIVPINLSDYDRFTQARSEGGRTVRGRYAVYLDIYLPYHVDNRILGRATVNAANYYRSMNRFFGLLETEYGIKVVIAAHPSAKYGAEAFEGREIYRLLTAEVVKDAEFVITEGSTSVSYAVLNLKPLIFVYSNETLSLYEEAVMRGVQPIADYLEAPMYNVDEVIRGEQVVIRDVKIERYEAYKYDFLTSRESEHTTTEEILWREINGL